MLFAIGLVVLVIVLKAILPPIAQTEAPPTATLSPSPSPSLNALDRQIAEEAAPIVQVPKLPGDECLSVWTDSVASFQEAVQQRMGPTVEVKPIENRYYPPATKGLRSVVMRFTAGEREWVATGAVDPKDCAATVDHIKPIVRLLP